MQDISKKRLFKELLVHLWKH